MLCKFPLYLFHIILRDVITKEIGIKRGTHDIVSIQWQRNTMRSIQSNDKQIRAASYHKLIYRSI